MTSNYASVLAALLAGAIVAACAGGAHAKDTISYCFNSWPPFAMVENGQPAGISIEILAEATRRAGYRPVFTELPWNRCLDEVEQGRIDAVVDAASRDEFIQGPVSYSFYSNTIWVREGDLLQRYEAAQLRERTVGLVDGYDYPPSLLDDLRQAGARFETTVDDPTNIRKLSFGRVDAIIADLVSTMQFARSYGLSLRPLKPTHSADSLFPSFNLDAADRQSAVNEVLQELISDGSVDAAYRRFLDLGYCELAQSIDGKACR